MNSDFENLLVDVALMEVIVNRSLLDLIRLARKVMLQRHGSESEFGSDVQQMVDAVFEVLYAIWNHVRARDISGLVRLATYCVFYKEMISESEFGCDMQQKGVFIPQNPSLLNLSPT